jgi:GNAT superfamily N-acetyltransferase
MRPARAIAPNRADWDARRVGGRAQASFLCGERAAAQRIARRLFHRALDLREYAALAGAPRGARVEVGAAGRAIYIELCGPAAAYRGFFLLRECAGGAELFNDGFFLAYNSHRGRGFGLCFLRRQVAAAVALGVRRIALVAGRGQNENGYYTWPRLGFDAPLPARLRHVLPKELRARRVLDVMSSETGRCWWRQHGVALRVVFDLSPRSRSRRTLANYICEKKNSIAWHKNYVESAAEILYGDAR